MAFSTLQYATDGRIATITLDRPDRLNAIDDQMPEEIAVEERNSGGPIAPDVSRRMPGSP